MLMRILVLLSAVMLVGCATHVSGGSSTSSRLDLELPGSNGKQYFLRDGSPYSISSAFSQGGRISFLLPMDRYIKQCVMVTDQQGKSVLEDGFYIYLSVRSNYQKELLKRQSIDSALKSAIQDEQSIRSRVEQSNYRLRSNRAYTNGACYRPPQLPIPARPAARCSSYQECLQDGAAICFSRYLGTQGCSIALKEFKIPGLLSSPGCAAAAAQLAGEKYELGDAIVDALHGIAEDAARNMIKNGDLGDMIMGGLIFAGSQYIQLQNAKSCTTSFVDRHFSPIRAWTTRAEQIRAEPSQLLASCEQDLQQVRQLAGQAGPASSRARDLERDLRQVDDVLAEIGRDRHAIQWCR